MRNGILFKRGAVCSVIVERKLGLSTGSSKRKIRVVPLKPNSEIEFTGENGGNGETETWAGKAGERKCSRSRSLNPVRLGSLCFLL